MSLFQSEFWTILCNLVLAIELVIYIIYAWPVLKRNFSNHHPFRYNLALSMSALGVFALLLVLGACLPAIFDPILYYPYNYYAVFGFFAWLLFAVLHIKGLEAYARWKARKQGLNPNDIQISGEILYASFQKYRAEHPESLQYDIEFQRKLVHVLSILFLLPFLIGPTLYYYVYTYVYASYPELYSSAILHNLFVASSLSPLSIAIFSNSQTILVALLIAVDIQVVGELFHNRAPDRFYPLRKAFLKCLREEEKGSFGSHVSMTTGYLICTLILAYNIPAPLFNASSNAIIATVLATIFGDMAASGVGRRWGKRKWTFNAKKSHLGTEAGIIVTFLVTFPFIGFLGSTVAVVFFVLTDVVLAKYRISDNFAFPILTALLLRLVLPYLSLPLVIWNLL